jgi:hypothetical protein
MKKEYLDNYDFFRNLPYPKLPKTFFERNINLLKKLSFTEIKLINNHKNTCYAFFNKLLLHGKFPTALNMRQYSYRKECIIPYKKDLDINKMNKEEIIKSIYYTMNKFDNIFRKMNKLDNIYLYRGMKNRLTNKYVTKIRESCKNINKKSNEKIIENKSPHNIISNLVNFQNKPKLNLEDVNVGDVFTYDAPQSTSFDPNVATNFLNYFGKDKYEKIFMKINIKKKDKIPFIFLHDLFFSVSSKKDMLEKFKTWTEKTLGEFEILLPRNIEYKVISKKVYSIKKSLDTFDNYLDSKKKYETVIFLTLRILPYKFPSKINKKFFSSFPEFVISS